METCYKHLSADDRNTLQRGLNDGLSRRRKADVTVDRVELALLHQPGRKDAAILPGARCAGRWNITLFLAEVPQPKAEDELACHQLRPLYAGLRRATTSANKRLSQDANTG